MRAAWYEGNGKASDVLNVGERPDPLPAAGEVRVRIEVSAVNPSDVKARAHRALGFPSIIPHSDGAGVVDEVGAGVPKSRLGERVWIWNGQWKRPFGTAAEWICLPSAQAVRLPDTADFEAGACVGIPILTALQALRLAGEVGGRTLLVTGGGSVVGHYVTQIAVRRGAMVIATAGSRDRAAHARAAGALHTIDYRNERIAERVAEFTRGRGVDAIIDMDFISTAPLMGQGVLCPHGRLVSYGSNPTAEIPVDFRSMLWNSLSIASFLVYDLQATDREVVLAQADELLVPGALAHRIEAIFPLERIASAHEAVEDGRRTGVILVRP